MRIDNGSIQNGDFLTDTTFWAKGQFNEESKLELIQKENIEDKQLRYRYSLPLLNDKNALTLVDNTFVIGHSDIDYSLSELWIRGTLQSLDIEEFPVSTIILANAKACIHLERLTPFVETRCFSSADEWVSAYSTYIEQGFLMNDLLIDGLWQSNGFLAEALLITLYADVGLNDSGVTAAVSDEANLGAILRGPTFKLKNFKWPSEKLKNFLNINISLKKILPTFVKKSNTDRLDPFILKKFNEDTLKFNKRQIEISNAIAMLGDVNKMQKEAFIRKVKADVKRINNTIDRVQKRRNIIVNQSQIENINKMFKSLSSNIVSSQVVSRNEKIQLLKDISFTKIKNDVLEVRKFSQPKPDVNSVNHLRAPRIIAKLSN